MGAETGRIIPDIAGSAAFNMACDELLGADPQSPPILRLYSWNPPALSLGYFQKSSGLNLDEFRARGLDITRRSSGGGAIVHWHELTYSFHVGVKHSKVPADTRESYLWILKPVLRALRSLGLDAGLRGGCCGDAKKPLCFEREHELDIVLDGIKIVGSAQRRSKDKITQHGSIILAPNFWNPRNPDLLGAFGGGELEDALALAFAEDMDVEFLNIPLTEEELASAKIIADQKYGNPEWIYGR